jgi:hypothetical protein
MTQEQKAKAYDEALGRAKNIYGASECKNILCTLKNIFPELCESEDEKIRKSLIEYFESHHNDTEFCGSKVIDILDWLEKQDELVNSLSKGLDNAQERIDGLIQKNNSLIEQLGELKSADKVEPKFKVGDCIRHKGSDESYKIVTIDDNYYFCEKNHAWAIRSQDYFELVELKPADWSEEDEERFNRVCSFIWKNRRGDTSEIYQQELDVEWLKSIKKRMKGE